MPIRWTDDALDAAIAQMKALRLSQKLSLREAVRLVLNAAWTAQRGDEDLAAIDRELSTLREDLEETETRLRVLRREMVNNSHTGN